MLWTITALLLTVPVTQISDHVAAALPPTVAQGAEIIAPAPVALATTPTEATTTPVATTPTEAKIAPVAVGTAPTAVAAVPAPAPAAATLDTPAPLAAATTSTTAAPVAATPATPATPASVVAPATVSTPATPVAGGSTTAAKMSVQKPSSMLQSILSASCSGPCGEGLHIFTFWTTKPETWKDRFSNVIDSAFYHHPKATFVLYSSSVSQNFLDDWARLGYNVRVEPIDIQRRAAGTPLEPWSKRLSEWKAGPHYFSHLTDAMRMLIMYQHGGVYVDTDVVFLKPTDSLRNVLSYESQNYANGAVLKFERENPFIRDCLIEFNENYRRDDWGYNGPGLVTRISDRYGPGTGHVNVLPQDTFCMYHFKDVHVLFEPQSDDTREAMVQKLMEKSYLIHYYNQFSKKVEVDPSSVMAQLFAANCVYCQPKSQPDPFQGTNADEMALKKGIALATVYNEDEVNTAANDDESS